MESNLFERARTGNEDFLTSIVFNFIKFVTEDLEDHYFEEKFEELIDNFEIEGKTKVITWPHPSGTTRDSEPDVVIYNDLCYLVIENKLNLPFTPEKQFEKRDTKIMDNRSRKTSALRISTHFSEPKKLKKYIEAGKLEWVSWRDLKCWIEDYGNICRNQGNKAISFICDSIASQMEDEGIMGFEGFEPKNYYSFLISKDRLMNLVESVYHLSRDLEEEFDGKSISFELKKREVPISTDLDRWKRWIKEWHYFPYYPTDDPEIRSKSHGLFIYLDFRSKPRLKVGVRLKKSAVGDNLEVSEEDLKNSINDFEPDDEHQVFSTNRNSAKPLRQEAQGFNEDDNYFVITREFDWNRLKREKLEKKELFEEIYEEFKNLYYKFEEFLK